MSQAFFVTGTGTDVGKTFFSSLFMAKYAPKYDFQYWKPIQTGLSEVDDTSFIQKVTNFEDRYFERPIYGFAHASSPHYAAKKESKQIDPKFVLNQINARRHKRVLIEGAGGIFVPWTDSFLGWQGIQQTNLKVVVVGSSELGTINHTLMTLECLLNRYIPVIGFYLVGPKNELIEDNQNTIQRFSGAPCLGHTSFPMQRLNPKEFISYSETFFDVNGSVINSVMDTEGDEFVP
ncbi:dethiobiotin synthase [Leptospira sp. 'Mane']|uniref:dethiobiotin synthase n=1 Tax=Leptospira sp. 'Mane' TaxID=3387407 RepID=UPI00398B3513